MSKDKQKTTLKRNRYNSDVINRLREKYGLSKTYITGSLSGIFKGDVPDTLKKEYPIMLKQLEQAIKKL